ncbi:hypothetical protein FGB62_41g04 [Gracilaria domingensis]|nr:hypothetical protein FGB62_41g04 [Gracilaria domingensis]
MTGVLHFLPGGQSPVLSIRMEYSHISGRATFRVRQGDDIPVEYSGIMTDIGDVEVESNRCNAYTSFYNATIDYHSRVGQRNPERFFIQIAQTPVTTPYVRYTEVIYDGSFEWTTNVAKHELAHVIRHYYDGDGAHFNLDENKYGSTLFTDHECSTDTSEGFAFNEGWALYWENACPDSDALGSYTVEGNVAAALRALQDSCDSSAAQMWHVLEESPGAIHSFDEYELRHRELFACP